MEISSHKGFAALKTAPQYSQGWRWDLVLGAPLDPGPTNGQAIDIKECSFGTLISHILLCALNTPRSPTPFPYVAQVLGSSSGFIVLGALFFCLFGFFLLFFF